MRPKKEISQKTAPLLEELIQYQNKHYHPFHVPGHKGGGGLLPKWQAYLGQGVFSLDLTEVEGLDDLHHPTGVVEAAQKLAASLMDTKEAYFLVNGVTVGIHAAIMTLCRPGDTIIMPRHAHRSVYEGMILAGARPVYLQPETDEKWGIPLGVTKKQVAEAIKAHPQGKAIVMVHPTYQGLTSDLCEIGALAGKAGIPLLVDEAHGAHFKFSPDFPPSAMSCGATVAVQGWHKTMGSLTQSGLLLLKDRKLPVQNFLSLLQSTSPSYILMASLDAARRHWAEKGLQMAEEIVTLSWYFRNKVTRLNLKGIHCLGEEIINTSGCNDYDPSKLLLNGADLGLNGYQLAQELRNTYRIQPEMASLNGVLLIVSLGDTKEQIDYLLDALQDLRSRFPTSKKKRVFSSLEYKRGEMVLLPGEAMQAHKIRLPWRSAAGRISGEFICPYPPGIPLVVPGEKITREALDHIKQIKSRGGHLQGPGDTTGKTVAVLQE